MPHELAEVESEFSDETDGVRVPLSVPVIDALKVADTVGEVDNVEDIVDDGESVPDPDCDIERVPQGDAVKDTDTVPQALAEGDGDDIVEPDALSDQLFELHPDDVYELDKVVEIVGEVECVPDPDCDKERVPQGDAEKESDTVPLTVADADGVDVVESDALVEKLFELVPDDENELDNVGEIVVDGESVPDPDCDMERVPHGDAVNEADTVPHTLAEEDCVGVVEPD